MCLLLNARHMPNQQSNSTHSFTSTSGVIPVAVVVMLHAGNRIKCMNALFPKVRVSFVTSERPNYPCLCGQGFTRCSTFNFVTEKEIKRSWLCNNVYILMLMFLCLCSYFYYYYQSFSFALSLTAGWNEWPKCLHQNTGCSHTQITRLMSACVCVCLVIF